MNDQIIIVKEKSLKKKHKNEHDPYEYDKQEVTKRSQFDGVYVAFYEIPPLKYNYPSHYHEHNTEVFYILEGHGFLQVKDGHISIEKGDIIVCPPGENGLHKIYNSSKDKILRYLDVDTIHSPEIIHYPDSNKVGIIKHNESCHFFIDGEEVDYYDGE